MNLLYPEFTLNPQILFKIASTIKDFQPRLFVYLPHLSKNYSLTIVLTDHYKYIVTF